MTSASTATDTRELIIESAYDCFRRHGLDKTTVVDIARAADVSRSTIYEYFRDKAQIVEACAEGASQKFYREMAKAMRKGETLEDQLALAGIFVTRARRYIEPEDYFDADEVSLSAHQERRGASSRMYGVPCALPGRCEAHRRGAQGPRRGGCRRVVRAHALLVVQHPVGDIEPRRCPGGRRIRSGTRGPRVRARPLRPRALSSTREQTQKYPKSRG